MTVTTDGASIVTSGGGFVRWATDRSVYLFNTLDAFTGTAYASPQVVQWCAPSSTWSTIFQSLRNAGFAVRQIGGSGEFLGQCVGSSGVSTDLPLSFWEARSS